MTTTDSAVRIQVANRSAQIITNHPTVADRVRRYFGPWWHADFEPVSASTADVTVLAQVDPARYVEIRSAVDRASHETTRYALQEMRFVDVDGVITAYTTDDEVAVTVTGGSIDVAGTDPGLVGAAVCRLVRAALRGELVRDGWVLLRASAVARDGRAYLIFSANGTETTVTALQLASAAGGALLANNRVFTRPDPDGTVVLLPWPTPITVGLGVLDAAGWYDVVADARHELYPGTFDSVLQALGRGDRETVYGPQRERKAKLYPDQVTTLLGLPLAASAAAGALLFSAIDSAAGDGSASPGGRDVGVYDTFNGRKEERYLTVFGLREPETGAARGAVFRALNVLPRWTVTLTHDVGSNVVLLGEIGP